MPIYDRELINTSTLAIVYEVLQKRREGVRTVLVSVTDGYSTDLIEEPLERILKLPNMLLFAGAVNEHNN